MSAFLLLFFNRFIITFIITLCFSIIISVIGVNSTFSEITSNDDCLICHANKESGTSYVIKDTFLNSIHGKNTCISCHSDIKDLPHKSKLAQVKCSECHKLQTQNYIESSHGVAISKDIKEAATCKSCHGEIHHLKNSKDKNSPVNRINIVYTCARCHQDYEKMKQFRLVEQKPFTSYFNTIHGRVFKKGIISAAVCTDCHSSHSIYSPNNPESKIFKYNIPHTCGKCHKKILEIYSTSIHAKAIKDGIKDAPVCTDCHGEHSIKAHTEPGSSVYTASIVKTCSGCHSAEKIITKYGLPSERTETYFESYHGLATQAGSLTAANCASCHGFHDILPLTDLRSSIHPKNLPKTCGKCHTGAGKMLAKGSSVHIQPSKEKDAIIFYITVIYIILIILTIGGMAIHNFLDFFKKLRYHYLQVKKESTIIRLSKNEKIQHIILLISFMILVYTGFAHKYPQAWWSIPFSTIIPAGIEIRKYLHRIAGAIFIALMVYHFTWILLTTEGRKELFNLFPKVKDFKDFFELVGYNIGFIKNKPEFKKFNYIEKSEYWALLWGSVIMSITGLLVWFENLTLRYFPKWFIDACLTVHFYEAVLATLAILVWHFYWTIFDPEVYPMNSSWLTGKSKEEREE